MTIGSVADYVNAQLSGATVAGHFRKVPSQASVAGWWADLSMASGSPVPNFYAAELLRVIAAALAGELSGAGTTTITIKGVDGSTDRITATVTADGDRTAVALDGA